MEKVRICDAFGWDLEQYEKHPKWFIELKLRKMAIDNKEAEKSQ